MKAIIDFLYYVTIGMWDFNDPIDMMFWLPICIIIEGAIVWKWIELWKKIARKHHESR